MFPRIAEIHDSKPTGYFVPDMQNVNGSPTEGPLERRPLKFPGGDIFFGPHGLRTAWRLAIYLAMYFPCRFLLLFGGQLIVGPAHLGLLSGFLVAECLLAAAAILPAIVLCRLENRPFGIYGLPRQEAFAKGFWSGVIWGFAAFTILLLIMRTLGVFSFGPLALHGMRIFKFAAFWAIMFLVVGFREEFLFRGYTLFTLSDGIGFWPAAFVLAAVFGSVHLSNRGESWPGVFGAAAMGLFFSLTLRRTGNLWFAVGMHTAWDWSETYLYSVPDSGLVLPGHLINSYFHGPAWLTGGSVGPEGSVFLYIVIAASSVLFAWMYPVTAREAAVKPTVPHVPSVN